MRSAKATGDAELDARLQELAEEYCGRHNPDTVRQMLSSALCAAASDI